MVQGYVALILHAHLPYVRHPEDPWALEERWLYEAITETYVPLLKVMNNLTRDNVPFRLNMSVTPPLASMLSDPLLVERYLEHLDRQISLAEQEIQRTAAEPHFHYLAHMYYTLYLETRRIFHDQYNDNLLEGFRRFQDMGSLEIITCAATHGYLPLIGVQREVVRAQVRQAVEEHARNFGRAPSGIWLPECAFNPGDDLILKEFGLKYFILDTHGLLYATPRPRYGVFAPIRCPDSGVHAFGRDLESSLQVWSAQEGYPGDFDYREFYRDIGYDLDHEYLKDYLHPEGIRCDTGFKYYRITGKSNHKEPYMPDWARAKTAIHAGNFLFNREKQIEFLAENMDRRPIVICPYDAELFGHWWFEGPLWLEYFLRKAAYDQNVFATTTPSAYLEEYPHNQPSMPSLSSWGNNGYNDVWLEGSNDWIYRHLHQGAKRLQKLSHNPAAYEQSEGERALRQAERELLLAQSSDWAFIMKTGTMVDYACRRTVTHLGRLSRLAGEIEEGRLDTNWLDSVEKKDNIFPDIPVDLFR